MSAIFDFLPAVLLVLVYAGLLKFAAAFILRWTSSWASAFVFSVIFIALQTVGVMLLRAYDLYLPLFVGILISLALQVVLGGWILGAGGAAASGESLGFRRGALLALVAGALLLVLAAVLAGLLALVVRPP
jgi:hypothetical protein